MRRRIIDDVVVLHRDAQEGPLLHRLEPQGAVMMRRLAGAAAVTVARWSRNAPSAVPIPARLRRGDAGGLDEPAHGCLLSCSHSANTPSAAPISAQFYPSYRYWRR